MAAALGGVGDSRNDKGRLVEKLGLKEGDDVNVVAAKDGTIEVETREDQRRRALERMAARNWTLPPDYKFDRDEANER